MASPYFTSIGRIDGLSTSIHECYDNWKVFSKHLDGAYLKSEAVEHSFDVFKNGFESASAILDHSSDSKCGKLSLAIDPSAAKTFHFHYMLN